MEDEAHTSNNTEKAKVELPNAFLKRGPANFAYKQKLTRHTRRRIFVSLGHLFPG